MSREAPIRSFVERWGCTKGRSGKALPFVVIAGLAACTEPPVEGRYESEFVDLWVDEGIEPCAGTLPAYDRFVEEFFGVWNDGEVPPDFRAELHAVTRGTFVEESVCRETDVACAKGGAAWTLSMLWVHHELVHVMTGPSAPWINEGAAVAFGAGGLATPPDLSLLDVYARSASDLTPSGYTQAGIFTRHLIDTYGASPVRTYHDAVRPGDSQQVLDQEFERAFGVSLEQALEAFGSEGADGSVPPGCTYQLWTCDDAEPVELPFVDEGEMDCGSPNVRGFSFDESAADGLPPYAPQRIIRFEVEPDEGPLDPDASHPSDEFGWISINQVNAIVRLERCGDCQTQYTPGLPAKHGALVGPEGDEGVFPLPVGSYALLLSPLGTGPMRVEVSQTTPP